MNAKQRFLQALQATGGLKSLQIGTDLEIYSGDLGPMVRARVTRRAIRTGEAICIDGVKEWYTWTPVEKLDARGSDRYTWDKDGNRVWQTLTRYVLSKEGAISSSVVRHAWRKLE